MVAQRVGVGTGGRIAVVVHVDGHGRIGGHPQRAGVPGLVGGAGRPAGHHRGGQAGARDQGEAPVVHGAVDVNGGDGVERIAGGLEARPGVLRHGVDVRVPRSNRETAGSARGCVIDCNGGRAGIEYDDGAVHGGTARFLGTGNRRIVVVTPQRGRDERVQAAVVTRGRLAGEHIDLHRRRRQDAGRPARRGTARTGFAPRPESA